MIKKELKGFNINIDDIEPNEITHGAMQELIEKLIIEENVKRFEIVLNKNILNIKDRLTDIHSYMGLKLSLEPLEKDISFIIRPTDKLTYDELEQENRQLKDNWNKLKELFDIQKGSEEYEALQWLEFQATNYKNDSIILHFYRILYNFILKLQLENKKFKKLKNNWEKLKEYIGTEWYCFDNESVEFEVAKNILNIMQEIEGSESNDTNR